MYFIHIETEKKNLSKAERRRLRADKAEYYSTKMHAVLWIVVALVIGYYINFIKVCAQSDKINRFWFNLGVILMIISTVLVIYMAIYVPRVLKIDYEPQVYAPRMLPLTGVCTLFCGLFFIIGLWPVYGLFTPGLVLLFWIATLMTAHFLPAV